MDELKTIAEVCEIFGFRLRDHKNPDVQQIGVSLLTIACELRRLAKEPDYTITRERTR